MRTLLLLLLCACPGAEPVTPLPPGCGDGVLDSGEQCDDGAPDNSDTLADACRTTCLLPTCGDGVKDGDEDCDDGNPWGGDGCRPSCEAEDGPGEVEPNDAWDAAEAFDGAVDGALPEGDRDCYALPDVPPCAAISAAVVGDCPADARISLHDPSGAVVAVGAPGPSSCATLDPADETGAQWVDPGDWAVCVEGLRGAVVPAYRLEASVFDSAGAGFPVASRDDPDADGLPDRCDADRDGDGVPNVDDNCPDDPNGPDAKPPTVDPNGFIRHWLLAGAWTGTTAGEGGRCAPSDNLLGDDDGAVAPGLGDVSDGRAWRVYVAPNDRVELLTFWGSEATPREAYAVAYVHSDVAATWTLATGLDDGATAWWNGEQVLYVTSCQGTNKDQFTADVTVLPGWNRLLLKVRDQGGGWGFFARLKDGDAPVTGLEISLDPGGAWAPDQTDTDGDGLGDVCDPEPA